MGETQVRVRIGLLCALHVATMVALNLCCSSLGGGDWWFDLCLGVIVGQASLAALWVVFGGGPFVWRGLGGLTVAAVIAWSAGNIERGGSGQFWLWYGLFATVGVVTAAPFVLLRLRGCRLVRPASADGVTPPEALQFSIRDLGIWMCAAALALGGFRWMVNNIPSQHAAVSNELWIVFIFGASFAVVGVVAAWAALGARFAPLRIAACCVVVTVAGPAIAYLSQHHLEPERFSTLTVTEGLVVLASLLVLRTAGYKLVSTGRVTAIA